MADNVTLNAGSGGAELATDDVAGVHYQIVKISTGALDSAGSPVSDSNPMPVDDAGGSLTVDNGGTFAVQAAQSGTWNITNISGTVALPTGASTAAKQPALGTAGTASADVITIQGVTSMTPVQIGDNSGSLTVDAPVGTPVFVRLSDGSSAIATLPVSLASVPSHAVTNAGTFAVQATSISAGSNLIGDVGISGARTSGGTTIFRSIDLDETEEEVKATAGQIFWIHAMNLAATKRYLKVYNATAASVVVGTTTPVLTFPLPTTGDTNGAGFTFAVPNGVAFGTAITVAATTGIADSDTGAPGANEVVVNIGYA